VSSKFRYDKVEAEWSAAISLLEKYPTRLRMAGLYSEGAPPLQRSFYIAGGNPADAALENWLYRSRGSFPISLRETYRIGYGGGLNLRGFLNQNTVLRRGGSLNIEQKLYSPVPQIVKKYVTYQLYGFTDLGYFVGMKRTGLANRLLVDAGVGVFVRLPIIPRRLGDYSLRIDLPFYINPPADNGRDFKFRWLAGFGRSW